MSINFTNTAPAWNNEGTAPSETLKTSGFTAGYKPPASIFNWFWAKVSKCISELQTKLSGLHTTVTGHTAAINEVNEKYDYSTAPKRIGTWIDGTPVWRMALKHEFSSTEIISIKSDKDFSIADSFYSMVINANNAFILNTSTTLAHLIDRPCLIDDLPVYLSGANMLIELSDGQLAHITNADKHGRAGYYGFIDFVTPEDNIKI